MCVVIEVGIHKEIEFQKGDSKNTEPDSGKRSNWIENGHSRTQGYGQKGVKHMA